MANNGWHHRVADTLEERFGLLDPAGSRKYRTQPVFQEPQGKAPRLRSKTTPLTAIGLTCGIGSMLVGARDLGFHIIGNVEWRDYYRFRATPDSDSTFPYNFPGAWMARGLQDVPDELLPEPGSITFAAGHPECGRYSLLSFSVGGDYRSGRAGDASDIPLFLKLVARLKPRFFLMDDLPASFEALPMSEYIKILPEYDLFPEWISNWGYGNIQKHRNRMFMVGALKSEKFAFVPGEQEHDRVLKDEIPDLIGFENAEDVMNHANVNLDYIPGRYVNMDYYGHRPSWRELRDSNTFDHRANIPYATESGEVKRRPGTLSPAWDGFCNTLSGGFNPLHPLRRLPLSIRERARIQGFGDDFVFFHDTEGPDRKVWEPYNSDGQRGIKQTGKAMPLHFCNFVAAQVQAHCQGKKFKATGQRVIKDNDQVSKAKRDFAEQSGYANPEAVAKACWLDEPPEYYAEKKTKRRK